MCDGSSDSDQLIRDIILLQAITFTRPEAGNDHQLPGVKVPLITIIVEKPDQHAWLDDLLADNRRVLRDPEAERHRIDHIAIICKPAEARDLTADILQ